MLVEPTYTMRVLYHTDLMNYLDYYQFDSVVPTEDHTWGVIKSLYKD